MTLEDQIALLRKHIHEHPDFPKAGVIFRDLFSIFQDPNAVKTMQEVLVSFAAKIEPPVECIVGLDARGFLLGPLVALELNVPFVPVRKRGKLPGKVVQISYALEYGEDTLEIQVDAIKRNQRVLIVDDLLATGGSLSAACNLVQQLGGQLSGCLVLMELTELKGRAAVPSEIISVVKY